MNRPLRERGGVVGKGTTTWGPLRRWGGHQYDRTIQGDQGRPAEGRESGATTKKILPVHMVGVKPRAVVRRKGDEGVWKMDGYG